MNKRTKIIAVIVTCVVIVLALGVNVWFEVNAIKTADVEIFDVRVERLFPSVVLDVSVRVMNEENRRINELEGYFDIRVLNVSIGDMHFDKVSIDARSYEDIEVTLTVEYDQVAKSVIEALSTLEFTISIKGMLTGKIFFGLWKYENLVSASWQA